MQYFNKLIFTLGLEDICPEELRYKYTLAKEENKLMEYVGI